MSTAVPSIRSMTGYARVRRVLPQGELQLSLRSVNHRGLDLHFHMSAEFEPFENEMRRLLSRRISRGHVDVRIAFVRPRDGGVASWNRPLLAAWLAAFRQAAAEHGLRAEPDLNAALSIPGMLAQELLEELGSDFQQHLMAALDQAVSALDEFRSREGAETVRVLRQYSLAIREAAAEMEEIRGRIVPLLQERLAERLAELLKPPLPEAQRLAQEAAILADRSDIGEEVTRLRIHAGELERLLKAGGEVGKKLDFLLQEMHREVNTILSKSSACGEGGRRITELGLSVKSLVEKFREQSLNLE